MLLDSSGAEDQRGQVRQLVVRWAEFHAVACQDSPSLAAFALPSPPVLSLLGAQPCAWPARSLL